MQELSDALLGFLWLGYFPLRALDILAFWFRASRGLPLMVVKECDFLAAAQHKLPLRAHEVHVRFCLRCERQKFPQQVPRVVGSGSDVFERRPCVVLVGGGGR